MKTEKDLKPLIDCDLLRYRCGFAADAQVRNEAKESYPDITNEDLEELLATTDYLSKALQNVKTVMEFVLDKFNPQYKAYIQGEGNFRDQLATIKPYKGNRSNRKPKYYKEIKEYLLTQWDAISVNGQEADDAMGIEQIENTDKYSVIVSTDKDMKMIPGWHYDWVKDELFYQTMAEANMFLFWQMLVGDTIDNIVGINKIGKIRADALLKDKSLDEAREIVKALYQKQYGEEWQRAYHEIGNLLYIRRKPDEECPLL